MIGKFLKSETGATLVEYGVAMVLAISVGGVALLSLGNQTGLNMQTACDILQGNGAVQNNCVEGDSEDGS